MSPYVTPIWCHNVMKRCCLYEPIYWSAPLVLPDPCKPRMFHNLADIFFRWCLGHTCASHLLAWSPTNQLASFHACIHTYIHTYIIIHTYVRTYVRTYIHIYICMCNYIYPGIWLWVVNGFVTSWKACISSLGEHLICDDHHFIWEVSEQK